MSLLSKIKEFIVGKEPVPQVPIYAFSVSDKFDTPLMDIMKAAEQAWKEYANEVQYDSREGVLSLKDVEANKERTVYHFEVLSP